jgi:hypothetical protein
MIPELRSAEMVVIRSGSSGTGWWEKPRLQPTEELGAWNLPGGSSDPDFLALALLSKRSRRWS